MLPEKACLLPTGPKTKANTAKAKSQTSVLLSKYTMPSVTQKVAGAARNPHFGYD